MNKFAAALALSLLCLAATACMKLGPDYERPEPGFDIPENFRELEETKTRRYVPQGRWWKEFEDPELNQVIENVISSNPDLRKAAASVSEAGAIVTRTLADQFPSVDLNASSSRQERSTVDFMQGGYTTVNIDSFSLSLPASFEIDLWGRLARATEAARAELLAAERNRQTVAQTLIAEAASQYFNIRYLEKKLLITMELKKTYEENLDLVEARYSMGISSVLDVRQARRSLAQSEAEIPPIIQALGKARHKLAVLQGRYPEKEKPEKKEKYSFELPPPVPAGLPSELLSRRPDIRKAEASLKASCAGIGEAQANRFPQISLTGKFGYNSDELNILLEPESQLWQIAAGIVQPVFDAGRRRAAVEAAEARYRQQAASYAKTLLEAFSEVEGALLTRKQQIERYKRLKAYLTEAEETLETALDRYQRGLTDYLNVIDAQQSKFQAELSLIETQYNIYANRISLYRSLGGGWGV